MGKYQYIRREPQCLNPVGSNKKLYCTCTSGLLGSSNHVARLLFRFEAVALTGFCNQTCTNTLATWNIPRGIKQIQPDEVSKFLFTQDTYVKKATQETLEKRKSKAEAKKTFQVMTDSQFDRIDKNCLMSHML